MDHGELFEQTAAPAGLLESVMRRINFEQAKQSRRRAFVFLVSLIGSLVTLVPAARAAGTEFSQSGFAQFFSLLFTDFHIVASDWRNFVSVLMESLPVAGLIYFSAAVLWSLGSLKFFIKNLSKFKIKTV